MSKDIICFVCGKKLSLRDTSVENRIAWVALCVNCIPRLTKGDN